MRAVLPGSITSWAICPSILPRLLLLIWRRSSWLGCLGCFIRSIHSTARKRPLPSPGPWKSQPRRSKLPSLDPPQRFSGQNRRSSHSARTGCGSLCPQIIGRIQLHYCCLVFMQDVSALQRVIWRGLVGLGTFNSSLTMGCPSIYTPLVWRWRPSHDLRYLHPAVLFPCLTDQTPWT